MTKGDPPGGCFAAFVTNIWGTPMTLRIDSSGSPIDASPYAYTPQRSGTNITYAPIPATGIPAGSMAIVFLAQLQGTINPCPSGVSAAFTTTDVAVHGAGIGSAIHLVTSVPAVVYDIYPYGGASSYYTSATLLLPTPVWDVNYLAISAYHSILDPTGTGVGSPMSIGVVAMQDNTMVQVLPRAAIASWPRGPMAAGPTVPASPANVLATFQLNKGQFLQLEQLDDLSGSPIQASAPWASGEAIGAWTSRMTWPLATVPTSKSHLSKP